MRVERGQHPVDRRLDQFPVIRLLDVVGADALEHVAEEIELPIGVGRGGGRPARRRRTGRCCPSPERRKRRRPPVGRIYASSVDLTVRAAPTRAPNRLNCHPCGTLHRESGWAEVWSISPMLASRVAPIIATGSPPSTNCPSAASIRSMPGQDDVIAVAGVQDQAPARRSGTARHRPPSRRPAQAPTCRAGSRATVPASRRRSRRDRRSRAPSRPETGNGSSPLASAKCTAGAMRLVSASRRAASSWSARRVLRAASFASAAACAAAATSLSSDSMSDCRLSAWPASSVALSRSAVSAASVCSRCACLACDQKVDARLLLAERGVAGAKRVALRLDLGGELRSARQDRRRAPPPRRGCREARRRRGSSRGSRRAHPPGATGSPAAACGRCAAAPSAPPP